MADVDLQVGDSAQRRRHGRGTTEIELRFFQSRQRRAQARIFITFLAERLLGLVERGMRVGQLRFRSFHRGARLVALGT